MTRGQEAFPRALGSCEQHTHPAHALPSTKPQRHFIKPHPSSGPCFWRKGTFCGPWHQSLRAGPPGSPWTPRRPQPQHGVQLGDMHTFRTGPHPLGTGLAVEQGPVSC